MKSIDKKFDEILIAFREHERDERARIDSTASSLRGEIKVLEVKVDSLETKIDSIEGIKNKALGIVAVIALILPVLFDVIKKKLGF